MQPTHDLVLVTFSVVIAALASAALLSLANRVAASRGPARTLWWLAGAVALGVGVWSAQFVAMLVYRLPVPVTYELKRLVFSCLVAIGGSAIGLGAVGRERLSAPVWLAASVALGATMAAAHYVAMSALYAPALLRHDHVMVAGSIAVGVLGWAIGIRLMRAARASGARVPAQRAASVGVMTLAFLSTVYTAMAAAKFTPVASTGVRVPGEYLLATSGLGIAVGLGALIVVGLALLGSNIDRRMRARRAEHELVRRSEERLRRLHEALSFGVVVLDPMGRVTHANQAAATLLGIRPAGDIEPREPQWEIRLEDGRPEPPEEQPLAVARRSGQPVLGAVRRVRTPAGEERWILMDAVPVRDPRSGELTEAIVSLTDITAWREAEAELRAREDELRQAQKMEAVGRLAGGIAHDFNNQLTAILGFTKLVLAEMRPGQPHRRELEQVRAAAERAVSLTRQLLAYSRKQIPHPRLLDLNRVVRELEPLLRRIIGEHIELRTVLAPRPGAVTADRNQLEQVIMNLAVNARDAMSDGGQLTIETGVCELAEPLGEHEAIPPGSYVMLAVTDTGSGMDAETRSRIFEPFFTTKQMGEGTGLGLSTVHGIVEQSGGHIRVDSEPGRGTSFRIYLPRSESAEPNGAERPSSEVVRHGSETVLIVEDEAAVRSLAREALERYGYTVLDAGRPTEALALSRRHVGPIHLLLTDVVMPGMTGRELARELTPARPEARVLYISGYTQGSLEHLAAGQGFLQKPFTPAQLARKVREVLD